MKAMWVVAILSLLALPVSLHSLYIGQANLLMIGCILFGLAAIPDGRWNRASSWLAAATLIKGYPLALALNYAQYWYAFLPQGIRRSTHTSAIRVKRVISGDAQRNSALTMLANKSSA